MAGLNYTNTKQIIGELEKHRLVERMHETKSIFKVYLRPKTGKFAY